MNQSAVLVVEDDVSLCEALCDTLELAGYRAESAPDGFRALDLLRKKSYDIVISDVQMEQMDGHALLKQIRKQSPDLPVLLMTAYGTIEKAVQAMREGAIDYLRTIRTVSGIRPHHRLPAVNRPATSATTPIATTRRGRPRPRSRERRPTTMRKRA